MEAALGVLKGKQLGEQRVLADEDRAYTLGQRDRETAAADRRAQLDALTIAHQTIANETATTAQARERAREARARADAIRLRTSEFNKDGRYGKVDDDVDTSFDWTGEYEREKKIAADTEQLVAQGHPREKAAVYARYGRTGEELAEKAKKAALDREKIAAEIAETKANAVLRGAQASVARTGAKKGRPLTESERKAKALLMTGEQANALLEQFAGRGAPEWGDKVLSTVGMSAGNILTSEEYQQLRQAALQLSDAWLRYTSGAAVPETEVERFAQSFLPQPGDTPKTMAQKSRARATVIKALREGAGRAVSDQTEELRQQGGGYVLPYDPNEP
jgi:hypothetical protein